MREFGLREAFVGAEFGIGIDHPLRQALDQSKDGIVWCNKGHQIHVANAAFKEFFRAQRHEIGEGTSLQSLMMDAIDRGEIMVSSAELDSWFVSVAHNPIEAIFRLRSGKWIRMAAVKTDQDGTIATFCDVSSFKKREAWLTELHDKLAGEGEDLKHFARHLALARAEITVALNQAEQANGALQKEISERRGLERELRRLANTDELTGALNRRRFMELTMQENTRARRQSDPLSILMIDLDHFKSINDLYGHEAGDEVLRQFSKVAASLVREGDLFARLGGEEFAALLPETGMNTAAMLAERVRAAIELLQVYHDGEVIGVTVSIGIAAIEEGDKAPLSFIGRADRALYSAKRGGRNRIGIWNQSMSGDAPVDERP